MPSPGTGRGAEVQCPRPSENWSTKSWKEFIGVPARTPGMPESPNLETARFVLRPLGSTDLELLVELNSDAEVMQYITGCPATRAETLDELRGALGTRWLIHDRESSSFLGWVDAEPSDDDQEFELGWRLRRAAWGYGVATESTSAVIEMVFQGGAHRVFAQTMAVNDRSRAVMARLGMRHCRTFHVAFDDPLPGTEFGEVEYELTEPDFAARHVEPVGDPRSGWPSPFGRVERR